jgi:hypothetical protein
VHLEILTANTMSEVALIPQAPSTLNGSGAVVVAVPTTTSTTTESLAVQLFDKDKQNWTLEVSLTLLNDKK